MSPSEVFNAALRVYRQLGWTFLSLTLIPTTFCLAGVAFVLEYVLPSLFVTHHAANVGAQIEEAATSLTLALVVGGPLFLIGCSFTCSLVIHLTSDFIMGNPLSGERAMKTAVGSLGALFVVTLRELLISSSGIIAASVILGFGALLSSGNSGSDLGGFLFIIGGLGLAAGALIFLSVVATHSLSPAVLLLEGLSGRKAAKRSVYLLKAQLHHPSGTPYIFVFLLYIGLAGLLEWGSIEIIISSFQVAQHVEGFLSGIPFEGLIESAFSLAPAFVTLWTLLPVFAVCVTLVYYERRIRLEGFDIETLAAETVRPRAANRCDV
jgi:hypothetical protein